VGAGQDPRKVGEFCPTGIGEVESHMDTTTVTGKLRLGEDRLEAVFVVDDEHLRLVIDAIETAVWKPDDCRFIPLEGGDFAFDTEGQLLRFTPDDPARLVACRLGSSSLAIVLTREALERAAADPKRPRLRWFRRR
jgi:hypothetical protein